MWGDDQRLHADDFAARTDELVVFAQKAARYAYAAGAMSWQDVIEMFPDLEQEIDALAAKLKETVWVESVHTMKILEG